MLEEAVEIDAGASVDALLAKVDGDHFLALFLGLIFTFFAFFTFMVVMRAGAKRDAVIAVEDAVGGADLEPVADIADARGGRPLLDAAVGQHVALSRKFLEFLGLVEITFLALFGGDLQQFLAQWLGKYEAADLEVLRLVPTAIDMKVEIVDDFQIARRAERDPVVGAAQLADGIDVIGFGRIGTRDATVDDVDRTADRLSAEDQHGRTAQHLDPLGSEWIDRDGMVGRGIGYVDRPDPIIEDTDPLARKAAQDGARCTGREAGRRYPGLRGEDVADLRFEVAGEFLALDDRCAGKQVEPLDEVAGDDDAIVFLLRGRRGRGGGLDGSHRRRCEQGGKHDALARVIIYPDKSQMRIDAALFDKRTRGRDETKKAPAGTGALRHEKDGGDRSLGVDPRGDGLELADPLAKVGDLDPPFGRREFEVHPPVEFGALEVEPSGEGLEPSEHGQCAHREHRQADQRDADGVEHQASPLLASGASCGRPFLASTLARSSSISRASLSLSWLER